MTEQTAEIVSGSAEGDLVRVSWIRATMREKIAMIKRMVREVAMRR